jgi:hypothetical protein
MNLNKTILKTKIISIDGTFHSYTKGLFQLLIVSGFLFGNLFPLIYVCTNEKKEENYSRIYRVCSSLFCLRPEKKILISNLILKMQYADNFQKRLYKVAIFTLPIHLAKNSKS